MSDGDNEIVCRASSWIKIRAVLILLMLAVFAYMFYKDGVSGYKEKNLHYYSHKLFIQVAPDAAKAGDFTAASWEAFAKEQVFQFPSGEKDGPVPDTAKTMKWPEELVHGYDVLKSGNSSSDLTKLWTEYTERMRLDAKPIEEPYTLGKIKEQFYCAYICVGLFIVVLFLFLRTLFRSMKADDVAYTAPGGTVVPYSAMKRIDKRKWDTKGVAVIEYDKGSGLKKVKVDGMIYGQFKKEDGEPAEKLFNKIMENFKGEVIEYHADDELEEEVAEEAEASS